MGFAMKITGLAALGTAFKSLAPSPSVVVVAQADHGIFVEEGTSRSPAQPFARPGTAKAMASLPELEAKAGSLKALVSMLAQRIAKEWRDNVAVDTSELKNSIEVISE